MNNIYKAGKDRKQLKTEIASKAMRMGYDFQRAGFPKRDDEDRKKFKSQRHNAIASKLAAFREEYPEHVGLINKAFRKGRR